MLQSSRFVTRLTHGGRAQLFSSPWRAFSTADDGSITPITMKQCKENLDKVVRTNMAHAKSFTGDAKNVTLEPHYRSNSVTRVVIPLSTCDNIRLRYLSAMGSVRNGKLLEDIDHTAVYICFKHNAAEGKSAEEPSSLPRSIVTGTVHHIKINEEFIHPERDIIIDGHISWTGRSTMQCTMKLFQDNANAGLVQLLQSQFIMASRDPTNSKKAAPVHPLLSRTPEEAEQFNIGQEMNTEKARARAHRAESNGAPSSEEFLMLHHKFAQGTKRDDGHLRELQPGQSWMRDTALANTRICYPENQNVYGKIFGGFLMREAHELATACAKIFCKNGVETVSIDDISFDHPVEIGHILRINSLITYTDRCFMQVRVFAEVLDERKAYARQTTNTFNFTLKTSDGSDVKDVLFKNYQESMLWLEGRRRFITATRHLRV